MIKIRNMMNKIVKKVKRIVTEVNQPIHPTPPYSHVVQIGDPVLRNQCSFLIKEEIRTDEIQKIIGFLTGVIKKQGIYSLSAPQIGIPKRIFAMRFPDPSTLKLTEKEIKVRQMEAVPFQVWVNPKIKILDYKQVAFNEECSSLMGYTAAVKRYRAVEITGFDSYGRPKSMKASGWTARIIQHELDHLDGILFSDIMDNKSLKCISWELVNRHKGHVTLSYRNG